ncbi:MAG TPA: FtsX-like permease family protein [Cyclobacteriaceae bacterium]|nr:FtsX-like permease family protein [Cyclobacteriaceae bacterium]
MLKNYLKTALRNLWRKKGSTLINVIGLSLGISGSLVLFLIISRHSTFDNFHAKRDRIYRVVHSSKGNDGDRFTGGTPNVLHDAFRNDFPEAEEVVFTSFRNGALITIPQGNGEEPKKYEEQGAVVFTQPSFFRVFDRQVAIGDAIKSLDDPNEAVISKKLALKYFGKEDAIGEIVKFENNEYKIGAIIEDAPVNTDFPFNLMLSYVTIKTESEKNGGWGSIWSDEQTYFLLKEGESIASIEARLPDFEMKYLREEDARRTAYLIQPLKTLHSDERFGNYNYNTVTQSVLITLGLIAVFLILTACINFINLATAEAIKRSKEVGIRKSLGSTRSQLVRQFLGETSLVTIISVVIAIGIVYISLGFLNPFLDEQLSMRENPVIWVYLGAITVVVSLLSGLYPSFVVSAFNPVVALKNVITNKTSSGYGLRRVLVIVQFSISQIFIIGTIVLINQMDYLTKKDLGFQKDAVISVPVPSREDNVEFGGVSKRRTLKHQLEGLSGVEKVSLNSAPPSSGSVSGTRFRIEGKDEDFRSQVKQIDADYLGLFNIEFIAGENVKDLDTAVGFVVNQKFADITGYTPAELIGKQLRMWGQRLPIVGVTNNFHTTSLSDPITAVVMMNRLDGYGNLSVKLNPSNMQATIKEVQKYWEATFPEEIFSFQFLDEHIREFYDQQRRMSVLVGIFASMAILIGCLGLLGLATFMANQKTKEIGIRKVLGASVQSIFFIFSKEFLILIVCGFVVAVPFAWYLTNRFLEQFEYKITLGPVFFLAGIGISMLIAFVTVGYKSLKAATINPVDSLKCE